MVYTTNILTKLRQFSSVLLSSITKRKKISKAPRALSLLIMLLPIVSFANTITWTGTVSANWGIAGNWSGGIAPTGTDDVIIPSGTVNSPVINTNPGNPSGLYSIQGLTINFGATVTQTAGTLSVSGNWSNNGVYSGIGGTVVFNGTGNQSFGGTQTGVFRNLTINNTGGTVSLATNQTILNGNLTLTAGIFDLTTSTINRSSAGGTLTISNGATLQLGGGAGGIAGSNFPNNFNTKTIGASSTVEYNSAAGVSQTIYSLKYGNLTLSNRTGSGISPKLLNVNLSGVTGDLTINDYTDFDMVTYTANRTPAGGTFTVIGTGTVHMAGTSGGRAGSNFPSGFNTNIFYSGSTIDYNAGNGLTQTIYDLVNYSNLQIST